MGYLGNIEGSGLGSKIDSQQFSGNNSDTTFSLRHFVSQPEHIEVFVGNVRQDPHSAYTVSGNTLAFTGTPPTGTNNIYVVFLGGAVSTNELPPRNNLGLRDGVSSAPSLFRSSQIGTGLFFPAANTIALTQNDKQMLSANATNVQLKVGGTTILDANSSGVNIVGSIFDDGSALSTNVTANTQLSSGVVTQHAIAAGNVVTSKINDGAVTAAKIAAGNVVTAAINNGAVTTAKISRSGGGADLVLKINASNTAVEFGAVAGGLSYEQEHQNFTAVKGKGYFVDTTNNAITATLPSSATLGDEVAFIDPTGNFANNNLTIGRNSHKIQGVADDMLVSTERSGFTLVYYNAAQGWLLKDKG